MANYTDLKAAIQQVIRENGNEEITGTLLQQSLLAMVNSLGAGYLYMGIATPEMNPGTPDQNVFYFALASGTYTDFGGIVVGEGETAILRWDSTWHKDTIEVDAQADWDQNDPAADDYIKHRTHYVEPTTTTINNAKLAWSGSTPENLDFWLHGTDIHIPRTSVGWGLTWQGGELFIDDNGFVYELGVFDGEEWSINPFDPFSAPQPYPLNVDVVIESETVHKLDQKFLDLDGIIPGHGTFAERPAANKIYIGYTYFRTDGAGGTKYPIFYGGDNKWYKADGTEVTS